MMGVGVLTEVAEGVGANDAIDAGLAVTAAWVSFNRRHDVRLCHSNNATRMCNQCLFCNAKDTLQQTRQRFGSTGRNGMKRVDRDDQRQRPNAVLEFCTGYVDVELRRIDSPKLVTLPY